MNNASVPVAIQQFLTVKFNVKCDQPVTIDVNLFRPATSPGSEAPATYEVVDVDNDDDDDDDNGGDDGALKNRLPTQWWITWSNRRLRPLWQCRCTTRTRWQHDNSHHSPFSTWNNSSFWDPQWKVTLAKRLNKLGKIRRGRLHTGWCRRRRRQMAHWDPNFGTPSGKSCVLKDWKSLA